MKVQFIRELSDPAARRFAFEATVFKSKTCQGFVGYGDADPSNVSALVQGAELRVAETRAINRALRKAYGVGICSAEEIGSAVEPVPPSRESMEFSRSQPVHGNGNGTGPGSATGCANSSASINSMPVSLSPTLPISVGLRNCVTRLVSRSNTSSTIWPTGPRRTAMPCFAN